MDWKNYYTALATIEQNPDGTFKRVDGKKNVRFLENWKDVKPKTNEEIEAHFKKQNPALAMLTGKVNGITVIDFDSKNSPLFMELYEASPTKTVETEKGFHLYYKYFDKFNTKAGAFGDDIDCRNDGGVIFCPPTPNYKTCSDDAINEITPEGLEILEKNFKPSNACEDLSKTTTRNDDLFRRACGWINHYDEKIVWSKMVEANTKFQKGALTEDELDIIYKQVIKYKKTGVHPEEQGNYQLKTLEEVEESNKFEKRYAIGIPDIDKWLMDSDYFGTSYKGGMGLGEMLALTGRPGHGKTLLATQITASFVNQGLPCFWLSYEVKLHKLKKILQKQKVNLKMVNSIEVDKATPLLGNIDWIEEQILSSISKYGTKVVFIDNLDFLETRRDRESNYSMNQQAFLSSIVAEMVKITVRCDIILVLIAHVRKPANTGYKTKRPKLVDVAGTSEVERLCATGLVIDRESAEEEYLSYLYMDKNREGGKEIKVLLEYKNGVLYPIEDIFDKAKNLF